MATACISGGHIHFALSIIVNALDLETDLESGAIISYL